jgi:hypothetical protein
MLEDERTDWGAFFNHVRLGQIRIPIKSSKIEALGAPIHLLAPVDWVKQVLLDSNKIWAAILMMTHVNLAAS